jgi:hypothetical protein
MRPTTPKTPAPQRRPKIHAPVPPRFINRFLDILAVFVLAYAMKCLACLTAAWMPFILR